MTRVRRLGTTAMIVSVALASALTAGAAPAHAAGAEILSPADGEVVKSSGPVTVSAKTDWYQISMALYVEGPSVTRQKIASGGANQTISGSFDPGDAPNGTFTITLSGEVTHKTYATSTFVLSRPPEVPTGIDARLKNASTIVVSWAKGAEPDLQSYEITSAKAGKTGSVPVDSACPGSTCQASLALPAGLGGENVDVSVRAFRSDGAGGMVASQRSPAVYVAVPAPKASPSPSPTRSKTPDQSVAKSPAAKTPKTRPSAKVQNPEPMLPKDTGEAGHTGPNDTELKLPEANGGSDRTEPVVVPEKTDDPKMTAQSSFSPLGGLSFGVYIALAVVLLLTGANLGAWLRRKGLTGDTAGDGRSGGSGPQPVTEQPGSTPQTATVAGGAVAVTGAGTAKARGTTPVRRPSVILARPKARENALETGTAAETVADLGRASPTTGPAGASPTTAGAGVGDETRLSAHGTDAPASGVDRQESPSAAAEIGSGDTSASSTTAASFPARGRDSDGHGFGAQDSGVRAGEIRSASGSPSATSGTGAISAHGSASGDTPSGVDPVTGAARATGMPGGADSAAGAATPAPLPAGLATSAGPAAAGGPPAQSPLERLASLPPLTPRLGDAGQVSPAHVSLPSATRTDRVPAFPASAVPASGVINGEMPERPLRQPEPDVWTEDDDGRYYGRHRDG